MIVIKKILNQNQFKLLVIQMWREKNLIKVIELVEITLGLIIEEFRPWPGFVKDLNSTHKFR